LAVRANQRERTRQALIDAASTLLDSGREVTISGAAAAARVSPATAYRYFSQPQELILESVFARSPRVITDLPDEPAARLDTVVRRLAEIQFDDEALWHTVLSASLQRWLDQADAAPDQETRPHRSGARLEMTRQALAGLEETLGPDLHRRLSMAVMLVYGMEALVVTRDACGLDPQEAAEVMRWAAQALLGSALREAAGDR
jgi:AcrR family transcriptional regulator